MNEVADVDEILKLVKKAVSLCLEGHKRVQIDMVTAYWVAETLRIDIKMIDIKIQGWG